MGTVLQSLIIAIGGAIAVKTNEFLASTFPVWLAVILAAAFSAAFVLAANAAIAWMRANVARFRRLIDARAQFEGRWALQVDRDDRPFSFAEISFNKVSRDYQYAGVAFTAAGQSTADWTASGMRFDLANNVIDFVAAVTVQDRSEDRHTHPTWGSLRFQRDPSSGRLAVGHGTIVDLGTNVRKIEFLMERISEKEIADALGGKEIWTERDKARLVQHHFLAADAAGAQPVAG
jgi:hypothetical protein